MKMVIISNYFLCLLKEEEKKPTTDHRDTIIKKYKINKKNKKKYIGHWF